MKIVFFCEGWTGNESEAVGLSHCDSRFYPSGCHGATAAFNPAAAALRQPYRPTSYRFTVTFPSYSPVLTLTTCT